MDDARRILQMASETRTALSLSAGHEPGVLADLVRVEAGGIVIDGRGTRFSIGTDWRAWFSFEGNSYRFNATVLETGAMLPNRTQGGVLLGFIDGWSFQQAECPPIVLTVFGPGRTPMPIGKNDARWVEATPKRIAFTLPADSVVAFVEGSSVQLELSTAPERAIGLGAQVLRRTESERHVLYECAIETVSDPEAWRASLSTLTPTAP